MRLRTTEDEWLDGARQRVRINHNGLSFARLSFESAGVTDVSLAIPGCAALVRIDWITVTAYTAGDPNPHHMRWDRGADFAGLTFAECTWLGGTCVEFHAPHAALWLPLASHAGAPVTSAQVTIAFGMLPRSNAGFEPRLPAAPRLVRLTGRAREEYRTRGMSGLAAAAARTAARRLGGRSS